MPHGTRPDQSGATHLFQAASFAGASRLLRAAAAAVSCALGALAAPVHAQTAAMETLSDLLAVPGSAGLGVLTEFDRSPYRGGGTRRDLTPLYIYEGERVFLRTDRVGLKFQAAPEHTLELFARRRFDAFPADEVPQALAGMERRANGLDLGVAWRWRFAGGQFYALAGNDASGTSDGWDATVGINTRHQWGPVTLEPVLTATYRSARINNYYFGVRPQEARPGRPAYQPGWGLDVTAGLFATTPLSERWRGIAGITATRYSEAVRESPVADARVQPSLYLGAVYDFGAQKARWEGGEGPLIVRVFHGAASDDGCHLARIISLQCFRFNSRYPTEVTGLHVGKTFIEGLAGWPLDMIGMVGVVHHNDRPYQRNGIEVNAFMKAVYYGFPWRNRVKTRLGLGMGLSVTDPVPYDEVRSQAERNRPVSRVLNYLDPTLDVSLGDLVGKREWRDTFVGIGVSHRSGIFAMSRLLGSVNGGSNYIHLYLERAF